MVTREPTPMSELLADKSTKGGNSPQSGGSAWAALTAPGAGPIWDKTAVEARFDPNQDSSKLGTAISKQVPLSDQYSLMAVERLERHPAGHHAGARHSRPRPTRSYETDQSAKLSTGDTGPSVAAGQSLSSSADKWLRKIGAAQKLFDGVPISGSVGETAQGVDQQEHQCGPQEKLVSGAFLGASCAFCPPRQ